MRWDRSQLKPLFKAQMYWRYTLLPLLISFSSPCVAESYAQFLAADRQDFSIKFFSLINEIKSQPISYPIEYYLEKDHSIAQPNLEWEQTADWALHGDKPIGFFYEEKILWLRIPVVNLSKYSIWRIEYSWPWYSSASLFYRKNMSDQYSEIEIIEKHRFPIWELDIPKNEQGYILFRLATSDVMSVPLTLYNEYWFNLEHNKRIVSMIFVIGIILAMGLYNLMVGVKTGDKTFVYYFASQSCIGVALLTIYGIGGELIWPQSVSFDRNILYIMATNMPLWLGVFTMSFLQLQKYAPNYYSLIKISNYLWLGMFLSYPLFYGKLYTSFVILLLPCSYILFVAAAVHLVRKDDLMAKYYASISTFLVIALIANLGLTLGHIPRNLFTTHLAAFVSALEALLFSFALGERINILRQQKFELVTESRIKSEFLAQMSHELRTPMNGIIGMSELFAGTNLDDQQRYYNNIVRSSGESLLSIINDILDFSKIEANKMELESIKFNLPKMLSSIVGMFYSSVKDKGIKLYVNVDPIVPEYLVGDPARVRQVIVNLISNAVKFTEKGYVLVTVSIQDFDNHGVRFSITDTGCGIPRESLEKLFSAFVQVDASTTRRYGGTGLGLAICKKLVNLMNGEIGVESKENLGSTFYFHIPIIPLDYEFKAETAIENARQKILISTDKELSELLSEYFICHHIRVIKFKNFSEIEKKLENHGGDLLGVIIDRVDVDETLLYRIKREYNSLRWLLLGSKPTDQRYADYPHIYDMSSWGLISRYHSVLCEELEQESGPSKAAVKTQRSKLKILCAEDNSVNQLVIKGYLKELGHEIKLASDGIETVAAYLEEGESYDLLLIDCEMPVMDGFEATRIIREYERKNKKSEKPIIAITAHGFGEQKEKCFAAGMNDHLTKPITLHELEIKLDSYIRSDGKIMGGGEYC